VATIESRAAKEGWVRRGPSAGELEARLERLLEQLVGEMEALGLGEKREEGAFDKARVEAISALTRTVDKILEITLSRSRAKENKEQDEDLAAAMRRIDERIVELAREYAAELVAGGEKAGAPVPGPA
jgi:hypothetical protein